MDLFKLRNGFFRDVEDREALQRYSHLLDKYEDAKEIPPHLGELYRGDFQGLLLELGIEPELWFPIMIKRGLASNSAYKGELDPILIPSMIDISRVINLAK